MSKSAAETEEFYVQIRRRMVDSGEWDRILRLLSSRLSEHGWVDEMRHLAKERAGSTETRSVRVILEDISPSAQARIPAVVRREIINVLRQYVKDQFEK